MEEQAAQRSELRGRWKAGSPRSSSGTSLAFPEQRWDHSTPVFLATEPEGRLRECEEIRPFWCPVEELPLDRMWADVAYWLPQVLFGIRVKAALTYTSSDRLKVADACLAPLTTLEEPLSLGAPTA
ncbi:hypothetical protein [Streptomyces sp. NPDC054863]